MDLVHIHSVNDTGGSRIHRVIRQVIFAGANQFKENYVRDVVRRQCLRADSEPLILVIHI